MGRSDRTESEPVRGIRRNTLFVMLTRWGLYPKSHFMKSRLHTTPQIATTGAKWGFKSVFQTEVSGEGRIVASYRQFYKRPDYGNKVSKCHSLEIGGATMHVLYDFKRLQYSPIITITFSPIFAPSRCQTDRLACHDIHAKVNSAFEMANLALQLKKD